MIIGISIGLLSYRSSFAAILDFRYNHIPLPLFATNAQFEYTSEARMGSQHMQHYMAAHRLVLWDWWNQSKEVPNETEE